jgi:hypothetical protein
MRVCYELHIGSPVTCLVLGSMSFRRVSVVLGLLLTLDLALAVGAVTTEIGPGDNLQSAVNVACEDFNGRLRGGAAEAGTYLWQPDGNPGWALAEDFKRLLTIFLDGFEPADASKWRVSVP